MSIEQEIATWDGKSADDIRAIYQSYKKRLDFAQTIIVLTKDPFYENGATWLLKAWVESGHELKENQINSIYSSLIKLEHQEAKLHVLQSIPFMPIEEGYRKSVETFLRNTLIDLQHETYKVLISYEDFQPYLFDQL